MISHNQNLRVWTNTPELVIQRRRLVVLKITSEVDRTRLVQIHENTGGVWIEFLGKCHQFGISVDLLDILDVVYRLK